MTTIALARIDDRLIHGQVVVKWVRHVGCTEIVIVDDALARDPYMQRVLQLAAPTGMPVSILSVPDAISYFTTPSRHAGRALVLFKSPSAVLALHQNGVSIPELNLGGMAGGPGARRIFKSVAVMPSDIVALERLCAEGVRVYLQMVPEERPVPLSQVLPACA